MTQEEKSAQGALTQRLDLTTRALRGLGASLLIASASSFLVQRWDAGNDLLRFGFLLAHTFVLMGAAYFCGGRLGESRSARLFLWTSLALVPVYFGVLGGLVYSVFALDSASELLPTYAMWKAPGPVSAVLATLAAFLVVVPTSYVATKVLVRKHAKVAATALVGLCTLLIVPVRGADWAGLSALCGAVYCLYLERRVFANDFAMRTFEGRLVRLLLWVPVVLLTARTAIYYPTTDVFVGLLILCAGTCATVFARGLQVGTKGLVLTEWIGALTVAVGTLYIVFGLRWVDHRTWLVLLSASVAIWICSAVSRSAKDGLEGMAMFFAYFVCAVSMFEEKSIWCAATSILVGAVCITHAILMGRVILGSFAGLLVLGGACAAFDRAVGFESLANWGTLSVLGLLVVIAAAHVERHRGKVLSWVAARLRSRNADGHEQGSVAQAPLSMKESLTPAQ